MKDKWENASQVRRLREHLSADFFIKGRCQVVAFKSPVTSPYFPFFWQSLQSP